MGDEKYMWYDTFANEYTKEREGFAPHERYILVFRGIIEHIYKESWWVGDNKAIDIAYTDEQYDAGESNLIVKEVAKANGANLLRRRHWTLPPERYDKLEKALQND